MSGLSKQYCSEYPQWMDSNMIRSMCGDSGDEHTVLGQGRVLSQCPQCHSPARTVPPPCRAAAAPAQRGSCPQV